MIYENARSRFGVLNDGFGSGAAVLRDLHGDFGRCFRVVDDVEFDEFVGNLGEIDAFEGLGFHFGFCSCLCLSAGFATITGDLTLGSCSGSPVLKRRGALKFCEIELPNPRSAFRRFHVVIVGDFGGDIPPFGFDDGIVEQAACR